MVAARGKKRGDFTNKILQVTVKILMLQKTEIWHNILRTDLSY